MDGQKASCVPEVRRVECVTQGGMNHPALDTSRGPEAPTLLRIQAIIQQWEEKR